MKYRIYIDEVGHADMTASHKPEQRYLSLTGVIFEVRYADEIVFPAVENLKRVYFGSHADEPVILHRKDIMARKPPFDCLKDHATDERFRADLLRIIQDLDYVVVTAVIDKLDHRERYKVWQYEPYHYCLAMLVERYVRWLKRLEAVGDVMAESRGGTEDKKLKASFSRLHREGTLFKYLAPEVIQEYLTSKELKVKPKVANIAGLQLADLLAYPSYRVVVAHHERKPLPSDLNGAIGDILEASKYDRSPAGRIEGYGRKWLP